MTRILAEKKLEELYAEFRSISTRREELKLEFKNLNDRVNSIVPEIQRTRKLLLPGLTFTWRPHKKKDYRIKATYNILMPETVQEWIKENNVQPRTNYCWRTRNAEVGVDNDTGNLILIGKGPEKDYFPSIYEEAVPSLIRNTYFSVFRHKSNLNKLHSIKGKRTRVKVLIPVRSALDLEDLIYHYKTTCHWIINRSVALRIKEDEEYNIQMNELKSRLKERKNSF